MNADWKALLLRTEISPEKAHTLRELHRLCDWVITLDPNAGIEYFDSARDNKEIYDARVLAVDIHLVEHVEGHAVILLAERGDLLR